LAGELNYINSKKDYHQKLSRSYQMKTIALSVYGNRISSRLDVAEKMMIVSADDNKVKKRQTLLLQESNPIQKINKIIELKPDVLICGGLTEVCAEKLKCSKIKVFPWVQGNSEEILQACLGGLLSEVENRGRENYELQPK
jgi:predicted Fe-Mo cluster-binding NifX family protein